MKINQKKGWKTFKKKKLKVTNYIKNFSIYFFFKITYIEFTNFKSFISKLFFYIKK